MVLSTVEPLLGITKDDKQKPAVYKLYDYTKGDRHNLNILVFTGLRFYFVEYKNINWKICSKWYSLAIH